MLFTSIALAAPLTPADVPNPRPSGSWVADQADVLSAEAEARINTRVDALARDLTVEIAVVTVNDIGGTPKEFATELFNQWGVGGAQANNGALLLLVVDQRRVELEVGYGLEPILPDAKAGRLLDSAVIPQFKKGDLGKGLEDGVAAIDTTVRTRPEEAREGTGGAVAVPGDRQEADPGVVAAVFGGSLLLLLLTVGGVAAAVLGLLYALWRVWRGATECPECHQQMELLDEAADDAHLTAGQRTEERIGSVDYRVYRCVEHDQLKVVPKRAWFSRYTTCSRCNTRAMLTTTTTLRAATTISTGEARVESKCAHCNNFSSTVITLPRKPPPSAHRPHRHGGGGSGGFGGGGRSGGGRSGGFGGGRSGGGGAGRSW
jgi:uncharacterized protein